MSTQLIGLMRAIGLRLVQGAGLSPEMVEDILRVERSTETVWQGLTTNETVELLVCMRIHVINIQRLGFDATTIQLRALAMTDVVFALERHVADALITHFTTVNNVASWVM